MSQYTYQDIGGCGCSPCPPCPLPNSNLAATLKLSGVSHAATLTYNATGSPSGGQSYAGAVVIGSTATYIQIAQDVGSGAWEVAYWQCLPTAQADTWYCPPSYGGGDFLVVASCGDVSTESPLTLTSATCSPLNMVWTDPATHNTLTVTL